MDSRPTVIPKEDYEELKRSVTIEMHLLDPLPPYWPMHCYSFRGGIIPANLHRDQMTLVNKLVLRDYDDQLKGRQ
jgi:hypothetical protein